jgi:hypothetical protein
MESPFKKISRTARVTTCLSSLAVAVSCLTPTSSSAVVGYSLVDGGSTAYVDVGSAAGMYHWDLGFGGNQLNQQWFWYRIGTGLAQPINAIGTPIVSVNSANWIDVTYTSTSGPLFSLTVSYVLTGGGVGSGTALIKENITVLNQSGGTINNFNLFQYSDFNLLGTPGGDSVSINGSLDSVIQSEGSAGIGEVITDPFANRAEAALVNNTLNNLNTVAGYNLNNNLAAGPGDVAWSFQWIADIDNNEELAIVKDKGVRITVIPEPSVLALVALSLGLAGTLRRRKA